ncbi:putative Ves G 1 allergen, partial [Operophtera brumata]
LDPARPLVTDFGSRQFRLGRDDAHVVQVIHTNAGFLGETGLIGHADFCRCSHFMSSCYFAASVRKRIRMVGMPCDTSCPKQSSHWGIHTGRK